MILDPASVDRDVALSADVCVIGSGAGGATVAHELAAAGRSVIVVEEGPYVTSRDCTQREEQMLPLLYADQGLRTAADSTVVISQGAVVGGSTVTSLCVCVRTPPQILTDWAKRFGLAGLRPDALAPYFELVEALAHVHPLLPGDVNANNEKLKTGAERLGFHSYLPGHNRIDCLGCGFCAIGCAYDRKADALTVQIPAAARRGAIIIPRCRVERVETQNGAASGISGRFIPAAGGAAHALRVRAGTVVLAAGAIASPALWLRSQLPNSHQQVGRNLHLHPEVFVAAVFSDPIAGWHGIPRAVIVDEFLDLNRNIEGGFVLAPTFAHPITLASLLPGFGADYHKLMGEYAHLAVAGVMVHDRTSGRVELDSSGRVSITYHATDEDRSDLLDGMRRAADIYFAGGAQRVILPYNERLELTRRGDYRAIDEHPLRANDPLLLSYHPQGTLRMGVDPKRSVVDGWGEAHAVKRLFVADASIFPTSTAVPPQLSVMAFAARTARHIAQG